MMTLTKCICMLRIIFVYILVKVSIANQQTLVVGVKHVNDPVALIKYSNHLNDTIAVLKNTTYDRSNYIDSVR